MARLLQYLECPQYLRKQIFPMHPDLRCVGLLNPLDAPHHPRAGEECEYREGLVSEREPKPGHGSYAAVGLQKEARGSFVSSSSPCACACTRSCPLAKGRPRLVRVRVRVHAMWMRMHVHAHAHTHVQDGR